jgi:hypothetical protein
MPGHDSMSAEEIRTRLHDEPGLAQRAMAFERRHRARATVIAAAPRGRT